MQTDALYSPSGKNRQYLENRVKNSKRPNRASSCMMCLLYERHTRCQDRLHCGCCGVTALPRPKAAVIRKERAERKVASSNSPGHSKATAAWKKRQQEKDPVAYAAKRRKEMAAYRQRLKDSGKYAEYRAKQSARMQALREQKRSMTV